MSKKIGWGVLSCANIARDRIVPALLKADNAELIAVAGRQEEKRKAKEIVNSGISLIAIKKRNGV